MRKYVLLLKYLIGLWDNDEKAFQIGSHMHEFDMDDMYFLSGLLRRGTPILFSGHRSSPRLTKAYVAQYCVLGSHFLGGRIVIKDLMDLSLRSILFAITRLVGSTSPHLASKSQISYVIQCLEPRIFNWSVEFLMKIKEHISKCQKCRQKQFGYKSFLVSFFLERVPQMQPQVPLISCPTIEPRMEQWMSLSSRLGNEPLTFLFTIDFFAWWGRQLVVIEDFPYAGVEFRGNANLVLLEGTQWDASGTKDHNLVNFVFVFICFWLYDEGSKSFFFIM
jgi:hypothetical protein